jgi:GDP-L-fucose synthase
MKVLVTGGTGFVGQSLQKVKPDWIYVGSNDIFLLNQQQTFDYIERLKPDMIVHLAATVGGIKVNNEYPERFFYENVTMNMNVISSAVELKIPRVLSAISVCAFPDVVEHYPFEESDLHDGAPAETNLSYGYSKRLLVVHSNACRKQYGFNYSTFAPSNLYGPGDDFDFETSHFVSAMIRKVYEAKDGDTIEFWGSGNPLRQQLYVDDLAKIIPLLLEKHNTNIPLIVAPYENLSIKEMINMLLEVTNRDVKITFNGNLDGQFRKDGNNQQLMKLIGDFEFTSFRDGVKKTYDWYVKENE